MAKSPAQLEREIVAALVAGDAELEHKHDVGRAIRKAGKAPIARLLGYTESGKAVHVPTRAGAPDTNDVVVFKKTKARFPGWTEADFMDAAHLYDAASEAAYAVGEKKLAHDLKRWHSVFWDIGGRWLATEFEARTGRSDLLTRAGRTPWQ